ncbi:hypothetical protein [Candidatus Lokiarchaeum ossiferum]|uniref:hypothetical protein n=1 Tax=Candidatus Lokiarchaeum ossiferum TaxID=2951803 RepID=UPI00352F1E80
MNNSIINMIPITISNPNPWDRTSLVSVSFENTLHVSGLQVYDDANCELLSQMDPEVDGWCQVRFVAENIPANGKKTFFIKARDTTADLHLPEEGLLDGNEYYLENDILRIIVEVDGSLTIMDKDEEEETPEDQKLIIMGEELGNGSIWAGDSFYYYPKLHQIQVDSEILSMKDVKYDLMEASDFGGKIQVKATLMAKSGAKFPITTFIDIQKGEKPVIRIHSCLPKELTSHNVSFIYPTSLKCDVIAHDKVLCLWDEKQDHGLGVFTDKGIYSSQRNQDGETTVIIDGKNLIESEQALEINLCLVPIKEFNTSSTDPLQNVLFKLAAEYYTPFEWKIN